jgi:hypothetical protein
MTHRILKHFDPNQDIYHHILDEHEDIVVVESVHRTGEINFHLAQYNAITDRWYHVPKVTKIINVP